MRSGLPVGVAAFVGRERERATVAELVTAARLVTLTGSGGCGKTRLALEVAGDVAGALSRRGVLVELGAERARAGRAGRRCGCGRPRATWRPLSDALAEQLHGSMRCWCWTTASTCSRRAPGWSTRCCGAARGCACWPPAASRWASPARRPGGAVAGAARPDAAPRRRRWPARRGAAVRRRGPRPAQPRLLADRRTTRRRWPRSAGAWTGSRWRWSWRRRGCGCLRRRRSRPRLATASAC